MDVSDKLTSLSEDRSQEPIERSSHLLLAFMSNGDFDKANIVLSQYFDYLQGVHFSV